MRRFLLGEGILRGVLILGLVLAISACGAGTFGSPIGGVTPETTPLSVGSSAAAHPTATRVAETPTGMGPDDRWIEVDLPAQMVRLHDGKRTVGEYVVATGLGDRPETRTCPGVFEIRVKMRGPVQSVPGVYVMDVVEFDLEHGNAFHSPPMDARGQVLDPRLGEPLTAGCVRVAESAAVFDFAAIGMKVWVH